MNVEKYILEIQQKLKEKGYTKKIIEYKKLQELHQTYGKEMSEKDFSIYVLEVSEHSYSAAKSNGQRVKILNGKSSQIDEKEIEQIQQELKEKGYTKKLITYEELQELHQTYGKRMAEKDFAVHVLEVYERSYSAAKSNGQRVKILNGKSSQIDEKEIEQIQQELKEKGYTKKLITYEELKKLHQEYGKRMAEKDFATYILEMFYKNYNKVKNKGTRTTILTGKNNGIEKKKKTEQISDIQTILLNKGYRGKAIDYAELQELHQMYGKEMSESEFAKKELELNSDLYSHVKAGRRRARILKDKTFTQEEMAKIAEIQTVSIEEEYQEKEIDYAELQELHQMYGKEMSESEFAIHVLKLSKQDYKAIKLRESERNVLSQDAIEEIQEMLIIKGYQRQSIDYTELQELHRIYGSNISEKDFSIKVLQMPYSSYYHIKSGKQKTVTILCYDRKQDLIRKIALREKRYYTKEEIESICRQNDISMEQFIVKILNDYVEKYKEEYEKVINQGRIWIGNIKMSESFAEGNYSQFEKMAEKAILDIKSKYGIDYNRDDEEIEQDAIWYIIETKGDIEKNFEENPEFIKIRLYTSIRKYMTYRFLAKYSVNRKTDSLQQQYYKNDKNGEIQLEEKVASKMNTEEDALGQIEKKTVQKSVNRSEQCIEELRRQIEAGATREEALKNAAEKLGLGQEEMLKAMQQHLISKGKVRTSRTGKSVSWTGGDER